MKTTLIHHPNNRLILVSDEDEFILADNYDANTPTIDLSQEVSDFLGIVDVDLLVDLEIIERKITFGSDALLKLFKMDWIAGFQKAQELNKKLFTEEDMLRIFELSETTSFEKGIEIIKSQPKEYEVEIEMEDFSNAGVTMTKEFPKITNNKIKVLTIKK